MSAPQPVDYGSLPNTLPQHLTLVFDGRCGFCTRSARWMRRLTSPDRVDVVAGQDIAVGERFGLDATRVASAVWAVAPGGGADVLVGGARAIALALAVGRRARWPLMAWRTPLRLLRVPWLLDRVYAAVAANRHRLPGDEPWCAAHPDRCEPAEP
ncbi:MAG: DUF393 domain-containing protein [Ilumatobacter sp.]|nr:DUF393 domain-containing protein [Ilumatobacter sp.]